MRTFIPTALFILAVLVAPPAHALRMTCDDSDLAAGRYQSELGYMAIHDDGNGLDYQFLVCHEYDRYTTKGRVILSSAGVTGTTLTQDEMVKLASSASGPDGC